MTDTMARRVAAISGATAVALGAFGAHGLKDWLTQNGTIAIWDKAVFYQFIHTIILFVLAQRPPLKTGPWWCFLCGVVLFSGSLYLLAVTNLHSLGVITPVGGVSLIVGWFWLAIAGGSIESGPETEP